MAKKSFAAIIAALVIIVLAATTLNDFVKQQPQKENGTETATDAQYATVNLFPSNAKPLEIKAEVADTEQKRATGLMFRKSLGSNEGMLFVFPDSALRNFWMKNTLIPLDMIFIAENGTIAKIHRAVPCTSEPCSLYSSEKPARHVLEVNANLTLDYGVKEGSKVEITS